jgi:UDP-2-acetamido-2-deoxy-ribo-hexuluronate aminotransferase
MIADGLKKEIHMDFIDLKTQQQRIKMQLDANIQKVLAHGNYVMGPEIKELERKLAAYTETKHAISCSSGTDALLMALMAYNVKPGDAVFTSPFTFIATAEVISLLGATPIFVDIDPVTFNMDPMKLAAAISAVKNNDSSIYPLPAVRHVSPLVPRGIIPVDLFGLLADYHAIETIAKESGLFVIEDAAQSFGAQYRKKMSCSFGNIACTSFFPAKPLGCYGDGGMCFTNDDHLCDLMESIRIHGKGDDKYDNVRIGINGRLDTLQAAILLAKFDIFREEVRLRNQAAAYYTKRLEVDASLQTPHIPEGYISVWAQYSLLARNEEHRSFLMKRLQDQKIPTAIYYPKPLHLQEAYAYLGYEEGSFPVSEHLAKRIFSLPMHPYLKPEDQERIAELIKSACD